VPPVVGCRVPPAPPAPLCPNPPGVVVVVVLAAGFVVDVVAPADDEDALDDVAAVDCGTMEVPVVVPVVLAPLDELPDEAVDPLDPLDGFVVLDVARLVVVLPPKSPGCAIASTTPAPRTTIAAINKRDARWFSLRSSSWSG
jgi:hypothetical protein